MRSGFPDLIYKAKQDDPLEIPADGISLDLLRAVYRNPSLALPIRMRAAIAALPHEVPKLAVTYQASEHDWAAPLDRRIAHFQEMEQIEARPTNGEKVDTPIDEKVDATLAPRVGFDRRFRRI